MSYGKALAVLVLLFGSLGIVSYVQSNATAEEAPEFGMVPHKVNSGPFDPGVALDRDENPFSPSRASTGGRTVTSSMFDAPGICGGYGTHFYTQNEGGTAFCTPRHARPPSG